MSAQPPLSVGLQTPGWFNDFIFTIRDIAAITSTPVSTVNFWCELADATGTPLKRRLQSRTYVSGHSAYRIAVLAALAKAKVRIGNGVVRAVLNGTARGLPDLFDKLVLVDGPAAIEVDLSQVWIETEPCLAAIAPERA